MSDIKIDIHYCNGWNDSKHDRIWKPNDAHTQGYHSYNHGWHDANKYYWYNGRYASEPDLEPD